jgi:aspartyl protease family protein
MDRLPFPGGRTAGSEMGHFHVSVQVGSRGGARFAPLEALVDTGATYTWVPRDVLAAVGVVPEHDRPFLLADGREVRYPVAWAQIRIGGLEQPTIVVFGVPGSEPILGVVTLEEFLLAADPVHRRLMPVPGRLKRVLRSRVRDDTTPGHSAGQQVLRSRACRALAQDDNAARLRQKGRRRRTKEVSLLLSPFPRARLSS